MIQKDKLIITPFGLPWDWSADYQKQTCLELSKNHQVIAYFQDNAHFFLKKKNFIYPEVKNILFYTPKYIIPFRRFIFIDKLNQILNLVYLMIRYGLGKKILLWIFDPRFYFYTKIKYLCTSLYDCVDYHSSRNTVFNKEIRSNEKALIKTVDHMFVNSHVLKKIHSKVRKSIHLVPQGFREDDFKDSSDLEISSFDRKKTTIGFVGALNERLDFNLLIPFIKNNLQWNFVFWGPVQTEMQSKPNLKKLKKILTFPNVTHGVSQNRREIPGIISLFDIAIIPYDVSDLLNLYSYPMKLMEYFYVGKPVLATEILELENFSQLVKTSNDSKKWTEYITERTNKKWPKRYKLLQRKISTLNSWKLKINKILHKIDNP